MGDLMKELSNIWDELLLTVTDYVDDVDEDVDDDDDDDDDDDQPVVPEVPAVPAVADHHGTDSHRKNCGNINLSPDNPTQFDCTNAINDIDPYPSKIPCYGGSCSEDQCCTRPSGTCRLPPNDPAANSPSLLRRQEVYEDINRRYDLSDLLLTAPDATWKSPLLPTIDYPKIIPCKTGYKNTADYESSLRSDAFAIANISGDSNFKNHFKVNCPIDQEIDFTSGSCAVCDDTQGYLMDQYDWSGGVPTLLVGCHQKQCNCNDSQGIGTYRADGTHVPPTRIGTPAVGPECWNAPDYTWCTECDDGLEAVVVDSNVIEIKSCLPQHRLDHEIIADRCDNSELLSPINGGTDASTGISECDYMTNAYAMAPTTCNFICASGYTMDETSQPRCELGGGGVWNNIQANCNANTCTVPTNGEAPGYDVSQMNCTNTTSGSISCTGVTCEFPNQDGNDNITYTCDTHDSPLTLSGCVPGCDPNDLNDTPPDITACNDGRPGCGYQGTTTNCAQGAPKVGHGVSCDFTCPNQLLSLVQPVCRDDGTWSSNERPLCENTSVDHMAHGNCETSNVVRPVAGTLLDSQGNQNCGSRREIDATYYMHAESQFSDHLISNGDSCTMSCDDGAQPTEVPQCNNGILTSDTGQCNFPTSDYQIALSDDETCSDACSTIQGLTPDSSGWRFNEAGSDLLSCSILGTCTADQETAKLTGTKNACAALIDNPDARDPGALTQLTQDGVAANILPSDATYSVRYKIIRDYMDEAQEYQSGTILLNAFHLAGFPDNYYIDIPWEIPDGDGSMFDQCLENKYIGTTAAGIKEVVSSSGEADNKCNMDMDNFTSMGDWIYENYVSVRGQCMNADNEGNCNAVTQIGDGGVVSNIQGCIWEPKSCIDVSGRGQSGEGWMGSSDIGSFEIAEAKMCYESCGARMPSSYMSPGRARSHGGTDHQPSQRVCNCYTGSDASHCSNLL